MVSAGFGFLQQLLYQQDANVVVGVIVGTKFAAVLLFVAVAGLLGSAFVATLAKTLITFATAAFLVFLAQGGYLAAVERLMSTGYSLFEDDDLFGTSRVGSFPARATAFAAVGLSI